MDSSPPHFNPADHSTPLEVLLACHRRIRIYLQVAWNLADAPLDDIEAIRHSAGVTARYFREAFPLHTADEEQSVLPRLRDQFPELRGALEHARGYHREEEERIRGLIENCELVADSPRHLDVFRRKFRKMTRVMTVDLETHLAGEERKIFPHIRELNDGIQQQILGEMTERRAGLTDSFFCSIPEP